jgi:hypothetical protein
MEAIAVRAKITSDMIGKDAVILTDPEKYKELGYGEMTVVKFNKGVDRRSIEQNNLYWACLQLLVENRQDDYVITRQEPFTKELLFDTKDKAHAQVRWGCKYINFESMVFFKQSNRMYFELDSISFSKADRKKAGEYYTKAFEYMADLLGITVEELVKEAQSRMQGVKICSICGRKATDRHHLFSNTRHNREMYGKLLDDDRNIVWLCNGCHVGGASIPKMTEKEFCSIMGLVGI